MTDPTRRHFLRDVGQGMLLASLGPAVATDLGLAPAALAEESPRRLTFGPLEPLVEELQFTPPERLLVKLVERLKGGTPLRTLVAAGALANARAFGGDDYHGFHIFMALAPAHEMARLLPKAEQPLPVLKVLHRNASRLFQEKPRLREALGPHRTEPIPKGTDPGLALRAATRTRDCLHAEGLLCAATKEKPEEAWAALQAMLRDEVDVHRVVLTWRAWSTLDLTGKEHAATLLRQSVRYCIDAEAETETMGASWRHRPRAVRDALPRLLEQHRLLEKELGRRRPDDGWVDRLARTILRGTPDTAGGAAAEALADGIDPDAVAEAVSLAANAMLLGDAGRQNRSNNKPKGSVHGDSQGVHASDAANAWRNIARAGDARHCFASLVIAAYHMGGPATGLLEEPHPTRAGMERITSDDPEMLLRQLDTAIRERDQATASAAVARYGALGHPERGVFDLLLRYAVSEDGALHAEKYYRTVMEEFAAARPAFRWRHAVGLARVTASQYGVAAPGVAEARRLLGV